MTVDLVTWLRVAHDAAAPTAELKETSADLHALLVEHIQSLEKRATDGNTPPASFVGSDERARFDLIRSGTDTEFLHVANAIATRLIERMDRRTTAGLLVVLRQRIRSVNTAAVFKLEVTEQYAGFLRQDPTGKEVLDAVRNLLDTPGQLQKGAVVPDSRPMSEVVVGDKLADTALYFLEALGIRQVERDTSAVATVVSVTADVAGPDGALAVARALQSIRPRNLDELLPQVQELEPTEQRQIRDQLEGRRRPVRDLAPTRASTLRQELSASGITVSGRLADMQERVSVQRQPDGSWQITIRVDQQPRPTFR